MKAIVREQYGPPEVLQLREIDQPPVADDEVLVQVHAAAVNPYDWHHLRGVPYAMRLMGSGIRTPRQRVLGNDVAGRVAAVGNNVTRFRPGDEVFGSVILGGFAEYASGPADGLELKPANLTFAQAAAVPMAALTALQGLRDSACVRSGQRVLIVGASGGVGTFAVQIAHALGAQVTGVCSTPNVEFVRSLGADDVVDYTRADYVGRRRHTTSSSSWPARAHRPTAGAP